MSTARVHYVKAARQRFAKVPKLDAEGKQVVTPVMRKNGTARTAKGGRPVVKRIKVEDRTRPLAMPKCGHCGDTIEVGQPYRWFQVGFRGWVQFRCAKASCTPKVSELESSRMGEVYEARDDARSQLGGIDAVDAQDADSQITDIFSSLIDVMEEVKDAYREADEHFGGGGMTDSGDRADQLESAIDELQSFSLSVSDPEGCGDQFKADETFDDDNEPEDHDSPEEGCTYCADALEQWRMDEVVPAAEDALDNLELP